MNKKLLDILACPICKGKLIFRNEQSELICKIDGLGFPIKDNIPVMLEEEARKLSLEEVEKLKKVI